jgi:hypothetical protein
MDSSSDPLFAKRLAHLERHRRTAALVALVLFVCTMLAFVAGAASTPVGEDASIVVIVPVVFFLGVLAAGSYAWALRSEIRSAIARHEAGGM